MTTELLKESRWRFCSRIIWLGAALAGSGVYVWSHYPEEHLRSLYILFGIISVVLVGDFIQMGSCIRELALRHEELVKQAALDNERIWRLEEAVAELKRTSTPTH